MYRVLRTQPATRLGLGGAGPLPAPSSTGALGAEILRFTELPVQDTEGAWFTDQEAAAQRG